MNSDALFKQGNQLNLGLNCHKNTLYIITCVKPQILEKLKKSSFNLISLVLELSTNLSFIILFLFFLYFRVLLFLHAMCDCDIIMVISHAIMLIAEMIRIGTKRDFI